MEKIRCEWANKNKHYKDHHDNFWGNVCKDENVLFKLLILESQATGLSFSVLLAKEKGYEKHFDFNNIVAISKMDMKQLVKIAKTNDVIKDIKKISSITTNAKAYLKLIEDYDSLYNYLWSKVGFKQQKNLDPNIKTTLLSDQIYKELKSYGFKYLGSVTILSYLQAIGIYNDHFPYCFKYKK
ncbi:DNA-3-methyladenine glycosylase I [Malacoplasma iowae]|uniref:3-methyladenine DNA glycosylase n=1 Tax=Malacoplasma iowae DK-CPA TaxID=1394179 RepID=A0A084U3L4_MALIO|nr:DNA-3-methyladenine glycosylase I [Malacoplasma iowae]KFB07550.1 3-methyladenine DNA glycosylase [Malacoplasma iowae DK-CPA]WPL38194.1 DNA-3-methyladenine glycosylase I [Malacoplasma iowae]WPL39127.1 DNA-3-methyladenine glycosylase I [Malacoplasma iowae]WPL40563.1 DNA-3-methyladenine glycosylase I [Malacoplasma iowae]